MHGTLDLNILQGINSRLYLGELVARRYSLQKIRESGNNMRVKDAIALYLSYRALRTTPSASGATTKDCPDSLIPLECNPKRFRRLLERLVQIQAHFEKLVSHTGIQA